MRSIKNLISIFLLINFLSEANAKIESNILVKVENEIITTFEYKNKVLSILILANQNLTQENIDKFKKRALDLLIQQKLKKIELDKRNIEIDRNKVNEYLNLISSNDVNNLKKKFKENNLNFDLLVDEIETQFKWQTFIYGVYARKINIDEKIIEKEIKDIIENQSNIEEFNISEIEVLIENTDQIEKEIENIVSKIREIGFEKTAADFSSSSTSSNNGNLGWIPAKSLSKEIYAELSKIQVGEVTKPIRKTNTILFLKLNNKKKSDLESLNIVKLKENIINKKKNELFNLYSNSHISKLKNTSLIEYK
tara:strand:- start:1285 stop:2211 length:927 start_codon:yes stop_codon:yes gene_type:complete